MACLLRRADLEHPEPAFLVPHTARKAEKKPWFQELRNFFTSATSAALMR
jgi:hypothetical protein